jgi:hypothetical protein
MKRNLITIALFAAFGFAASANAQIANPDNDSATFFKYDAIAGNPAKPNVGQVRVGDVSPDGLYVYVNAERGWSQRGHSYEWVAGGLAHTANCLPYNLPKPVVGAGILVVRTGPFADHGA